MSLKSILFAGSAFASLIAFAAPAQAAPYYRCGYDWCYDDQYEETRELNLMQLEHPGAGLRAVPGHHDDYDDDDDAYGDDRGGRWGDRYGDDDDDRYPGDRYDRRDSWPPHDDGYGDEDDGYDDSDD